MMFRSTDTLSKKVFRTKQIYCAINYCEKELADRDTDVLIKLVSPEKAIRVRVCFVAKINELLPHCYQLI